ncbi:hypothetical protein [Cellulomonas soli]
MAMGFDVDFSALSSAATRIRQIVEDATAQTVCTAWGHDYGHPALSQAVQLFVSDVDLAVDSHAARTAALAAELDEQVRAYESDDTATGTHIQGLAARLSPSGTWPSGAPTPFGIAAPGRPVAPLTETPK